MLQSSPQQTLTPLQQLLSTILHRQGSPWTIKYGIVLNGTSQGTLLLAKRLCVLWETLDPFAVKKSLEGCQRSYLELRQAMRSCQATSTRATV
jgi:hypothetical protein